MASCIAFMKHVADERIPSQERKKRAKGLIEEYLPLEEQINSHGRRLINDPVGEKIWEYCVTEADRVVRELKLGREPAIDVAGLEKAVDSLYGVSPFELLELMAA